MPPATSPRPRPTSVRSFGAARRQVARIVVVLVAIGAAGCDGAGRMDDARPSAEAVTGAGGGTESPPHGLPGASRSPVGVTPGTGGSTSSAPITGRQWWHPTIGSGWWWQLEDPASVPADLTGMVVDVDLVEAAEIGLVADLQAAGNRVVCYFSAGTWESFRPDADAVPSSARLDDAALGDFPDEVWLAIGDPAARPAIEAVMATRLDAARAAGCDGVEPGNVDGWANPDETGGAITAADQLDWNRWLADQAHARGLAVGLKNDVDQLDDLVADFDFAVVEQCWAYDECDAWVETFLDVGKPVFVQEYGDDGGIADDDGDGVGDGTITRHTWRRRACPELRSRRFAAAWIEGLALDGDGVAGCPPPEPQ